MYQNTWILKNEQKKWYKICSTKIQCEKYKEWNHIYSNFEIGKTNKYSDQMNT